MDQSEKDKIFDFATVLSYYTAQGIPSWASLLPKNGQDRVYFLAEAQLMCCCALIATSLQMEGKIEEVRAPGASKQMFDKCMAVLESCKQSEIEAFTRRN